MPKCSHSRPQQLVLDRGFWWSIHDFSWSNSWVVSTTMSTVNIHVRPPLFVVDHEAHFNDFSKAICNFFSILSHMPFRLIILCSLEFINWLCTPNIINGLQICQDKYINKFSNIVLCSLSVLTLFVCNFY